MKQDMLQTRNPLRLRIPIIIFSLHALYFSLIQFAVLILRDDHNYIYSYGGWKIEFGFPSNLSDLLWCTVYIVPCIPCILLATYVLFLYTKPKSSIVISTVFFLIAFIPIYEYIIEVIDYLVSGYGMPRIITPNFIIFDLPYIVAFVLTGLSVLKGLRSKVLPLTAIIVGFISEIYYFPNTIISFRHNFELGYYLYATYVISRCLTTFLLLVALLLFVLRNRVVPIFTHQHKKQLNKISKMTPEHALKALKENFELGIISEEEYQTRRTEILEKL